MCVMETYFFPFWREEEEGGPRKSQIVLPSNEPILGLVPTQEQSTELGGEPMEGLRAEGR